MPTLDDVGDVAARQRLDQLAHVRPHHRGGAIGVLRDRGIGGIAAQRGVQRGAAFGDVDLLAAEQALERPFHVALGGQRQQRVQRGVVVFLPREVEVQRTDPFRIPRRPAGVGGEQIGNGGPAQALGVGVQRVESVGLCHAACVGMLWLVWVILLRPSTYTRSGLKTSASAASQADEGSNDDQVADLHWRAAPPLSEITPLPASARIA